MAVYRVMPRDDDTDTRSSWKVHKDGVGDVSKNHVKKSAAEREARRMAGPDDSVVLHRVDGTVMPK